MEVGAALLFSFCPCFGVESLRRRLGVVVGLDEAVLGLFEGPLLAALSPSVSISEWGRFFGLADVLVVLEAEGVAGNSRFEKMSLSLRVLGFSDEGSVSVGVGADAPTVFLRLLLGLCVLSVVESLVEGASLGIAGSVRRRFRDPAGLSGFELFAEAGAGAGVSDDCELPLLLCRSISASI